MRADETPVLRMRGVAKRFGPTVALAGVDLEVRRGEVHALLGENGAGKSTLMKVLAGVHRPDQGAIEVDGRPFDPGGPLAALRAGIAMIYQELSLAPHLSVEDNLHLGREPARFGVLRRAAARPGVAAALERLGHPEIAPRTRVLDLGPGPRQLVEIARALHAGARILVMDEPTSSLAGPDVDRLFALVRRLRDDGVAVIWISHLLEEVRAVAARFTVLRDGATAGTGEVAAVRNAELIELMIGRRPSELFPPRDRNPGTTVLCVEDLAGRRRPVAASFEVRRGEILGIGGLVGAGRTETLRAVFGLDAAVSGRIAVGDAVDGGRSARSRTVQGFGFLSEDRKGEGLALRLPIDVNLTLSRTGACSRAGLVDAGARRDAARRWMDRLCVKARGPSQPAVELSGGNQQKVALARLLHQGASILLLDEPTRGVDIGSRAGIYRILDELARGGAAVIVVSSCAPELLGLCDRIAVMSRGVLGPPRPAAEWTEHALLAAST